MAYEKTVTILGFGHTAIDKKHCIEDHCEGDIWSLNNGYLTFPKMAQEQKFSRWFEIHNMDYLKTYKPDLTKHVDHWTRLDMLGCPVIMQERIPHAVSHSVRYPFEDIWQFFGSNYFLGSPSYMLALALYEGYRKIVTWGIDTADEQHKQQRASWAWWTRQACTMGVSLGGSALGFLGEGEQDAGLQGLRERITAGFTAAQKQREETARQRAAEQQAERPERG